MKRLDRCDTALVVVDIQEKLFPKMAHKDDMLEHALTMIRAARKMQLPLLVTEQYPKGIGHTLAEVAQACGDAAVIEKLDFSIWGQAEFRDALNTLNVNNVLLVGIEMHVCVAQSALDLATHGYDVFIARDACSSRNVSDYETAQQRLRDSGVVITTVEAAVFELLGQAGTPLFKEVLPLIK